MTPGKPQLTMNKADKMITFIYYKDLAKGVAFQESTANDLLL